MNVACKIADDINAVGHRTISICHEQAVLYAYCILYFHAKILKCIIIFGFKLRAKFTSSQPSKLSASVGPRLVTGAI